MVNFIVKVLGSYSFQRASTAVLLFSSILLGARAIEQSAYAQILQIMFLGKFLIIGNLGATSGFFVSYYGKVGMLKNYNADTEFRYCLTLLLHLLIVFVPIAVISIYVAPAYVLGIVIFLFLIPVYVVEPPSRLRRKFYVSLIPDILMSIALLSASALHMIGGQYQYFSITALYVWLTAAFSLILYSAVVYFLGGVSYIRSRLSNIKLKEYLSTAALGMPVYLGTALFMLTSGLDRFLMPLHIGTDEQAVYFLSYQIATGAMIFLASANFVNTIDLGDAHKSGSESFMAELRKKLGFNIALAISSNLLLLFISFALHNFFLPDYSNLVTIIMLLALGLSAFFVAGSITPILAYLRKQLALTIAMALAAGAVLLSNLVAIQLGLGVVWLSFTTSVVLVVYSLFAIAYTINTVRKT
jgi:O-antigen/teichoic acid export membrane protein